MVPCVIVKRILLPVATLVVLAIIVPAVFFVLRDRDSTTGVSAANAAAAAHVKVSHRKIAPGLRPTASTFTYVGHGTEHLSLLGGSTHVFPAKIHGVVSLNAHDSCAWKLSLVMVAEHVEHHGYCTTGASVRDTGFDRTTSFMGHEQTSTYTCTPGALRVRTAARVGTRAAWTCTEARGGVVHYTATFIGTEPVTVSGKRTPARHVHIVATQHDKSQGTERSDWWYLPTGLPARMSSNRSLSTSAGPLGTMTLTERFDYRLAA